MLNNAGQQCFASPSCVIHPKRRSHTRFLLLHASVRGVVCLSQVMTAARRPESPVIVRCQQRSIVVKWYPGTGGAYKYCLQARLVEGLDGVGALIEATRTAGGGGGGAAGGTTGGRRKAWGATGTDGDGGWVTVYEGVDSTAKVCRRLLLLCTVLVSLSAG